MIKIPVSKPFLKNLETKLVLDCMKSKWISSKGKYINLFEQKIKKKLNSKYCVSCSNGTVALILAIKACGIKPGDEIIVPDLSFSATINAVINSGAKPIICEVNKKTWCLETKKIEERITKKTKAIIPVHLYGNSCLMDDLIKLKKKYKLFIIEDSAEAFGSKYKNKFLGSIGDVGCFSFFANKTVTTGEGGCCITNNNNIYKKMLLYRNNGFDEKKKYYSILPGFNFKMTNLQAAIGYAQLKNSKKIFLKRKKITESYKKNLKKFNIANIEEQFLNNVKKVEWLYSIILKKTNISRLTSFLLDKGIETRKIFYPFHQQKIYKKYIPDNFEKSASTYIHKYGITLPTFNNLTNNQIVKIIKFISQFQKI